ncbi:hypothetical protein AB6A40_005070 [Gnathostoma spinigerum]|uniref:Uncharacterized protein n=1 Tax=Gnathostoma spinigerum TaxID=75299 RepID=A0ABD6EGM8_9BILA
MAGITFTPNSLIECTRMGSLDNFSCDFYIGNSEIEIPLFTPPCSPVERPSSTSTVSESESNDDDLIKRIQCAMHNLYDDSIQNNRTRYRNAMNHLKFLLSTYNLREQQESHSRTNSAGMKCYAEYVANK